MIDIYKMAKFVSDNIKSVVEFDYSFYSYIDTWLSWYKGEIADFHSYEFYNGLDVVKCDMAKLHMAKQICADVASMAFNENVIINISDEKSNQFIQGFDQSGGVLAESNFWENATQMYEGGVCALGTAALEVYVDNLKVMGNKVIPDKDTKIKIGFIRADHILPISFENKVISEVCFMNEIKINGKDYVDLRAHIKDIDGTYIIINKRVHSDIYGNFVEDAIDDGVVNEFRTGSDIPFFSIIKTAYANNIDLIGNNPLGISIYANAVDVLKSCDLAYDALQKEVALGQKFIFLNKSMLGMDEQGRIMTPYDVRQRLFQFIGDNATVSDNNWVHEFVPTLRIDDLTSNLEKQLDYLSSKVGLGDHFYKFKDGSAAKTATEVLSENSSAYRNIRRSQISIEQALIKLVRCLLYCGITFCGADVNLNCNISVQFDPSVIENKETVRQRDLEEVRLGILSKEEYRSKYHAESIDKARENISKIGGTSND